MPNVTESQNYLGIEDEPYSHLRTLKQKQRGEMVLRAKCRAGWEGEKFWLENFSFIEADDAIVKTIADAGGLRLGQRMFLSLSWHQRHIWKCPERTIIDKSRQVGLSTVEELKMYRDIKEKGWSGAVIADDLTSAEYLFEKFERCHANDVIDKPKTRKANVRQIRFAGQQGRAEVCTAGSPDALRSRTLQTIHGSEVAYWGEEAPKLHKAIMKFVGQKPETSVVYESTANMEDPLFYPMWQNSAKYCKLRFVEDAKAPYGLRIERTINDPDNLWNKFHPLFISVLVDERAQTPLEPGDMEHILATMDPEEEWLLTDHDASFEFLKWRRNAIVHESNGDINDFHQEFPVTAEQSFIAIGKLRYNRDILNRMKIEPGSRGTIKSATWNQMIRFTEDKGGAMIMYRQPEPGHRYVMGIDPCEGIPSENPNCPFCSGEADEFSAQVYDIDAVPKIEQVALIYGPFSEDEISQLCINCAAYFNYAYTVIERVGGFGTHLMAEFEKGYPPERLYHEEGKREPGLKVTSANRMGLIDDVADAVHDELIEIHSERTVHQLKMMKRIRPTRDEAKRGHHDDDQASLWGCCRGWTFYPNTLSPMEQHQVLVDRQRRGIKGRIGQTEQVFQNPDDQGFY